MNSFWQNIVGHQASIKQLQNAIGSNRLPHALLFSGPEGVGKKKVAQAVASTILTKKNTHPETENLLQLISTGNHPDLHFVYKNPEKKDLTVEVIRDICTKIKLKPYYSSCSVAIINDAHSMNASAFNSLLMTLEEPCPESYLILISDQPQRIPETILSRCQSIFFNELKKEQLSQILKQNLNLDSKQIEDLLKISHGSLANLELDGFTHPTSLKLQTNSELLDHLRSLSLAINSLGKLLVELLEKHRSQTLTSQDIVVFCTKLKEQEDKKLLWKTINAFFRNVLLSESNLKETRTLSSLLEQLIKSEKLVHERNLNEDLHLNTAFLGLIS